MLLVGRQGLALPVSEKIILAGGSGIFPENLAFPEAFAARDARGKKTESAHPAAGNQAAAKRKRSGTYLQTVESDTGNMQSSR